MRFVTLLLAILISVPAWAQTVSPAPNSTVSTNPPGISATFLTPIRSVRVLIDGQDYTNQSRLIANQVLLNPSQPLAPGLHQVSIEAVNLLGLTERANWAFFVAGAPTQVAPKTPSAYTPFPGTVVEGSRPILSAEFPETLTTARMSLDRYDLGSVQIVGNRANYQTQTDFSLGQHIANVDAIGVSGQPYSGQWMFTIKAAPTPLPPPPPPPGGVTTPSGSSITLSNLNPPPNASLRMARPWISADFPQQVNNARMLVDGVDVTSQTQRTANRISWNPSYDLQAGQHSVLVDGVASTGQVLAGSWTFTLDGLAPAPTPTPPPAHGTVPIRLQTPYPNQRVGTRLELRGQGPPGATLRVTLRELNSGRVVNYQTTIKGDGSFGARADLKWAPSRSRLELSLTAGDRVTGIQIGQPLILTIRRQ